MLDLDSKNKAKVSRLTEQLKDVRVKQQYSNNSSLGTLHEEKEDKDMDKSGNNTDELAEAQLSSAQVSAQVSSPCTTNERKEDKISGKTSSNDAQAVVDSSYVESLQQQLHYAREAKRLETGRLMDMKRELAASDLRNNRIIEDLKAKLQSSNAAASAESDQAHQRAVEALKEEVKNTKALLAAEQQLTKLLQDKLSIKEDELRKALQSREEVTRQMSAPSKLSDSTPSNLSALLRCPARKPQSQAVGGISYQTAVWQTVASLRGVLALQVDGRELIIKEASKKAFEIWGAAALRGPTQVKLPSLLVEVASGAWLKEEIFSRVSRCADFWLREIGCLEFRSKTGSTFDSVVSAAHLPRESHGQASKGTDSSVVIIIEPMEEEPPQRQKVSKQSACSSTSSDPRGSLMQYGRTGTDVSSTTSNDIGPNDSISNVF